MTFIELIYKLIDRRNVFQGKHDNGIIVFRPMVYLLELFEAFHSVQLLGAIGPTGVKKATV